MTSPLVRRAAALVLALVLVGCAEDGDHDDDAVGDDDASPDDDDSATGDDDSAGDDDDSAGTDDCDIEVPADLTGLLLADNTAGEDGGGLFAWTRDGYLDVTGDQWWISGNAAGSQGGGLGLYIEQGEGRLTVSHLRATGNQATDGGGLSVYTFPGDAALELTNAVFVGSEAAQDGGGVRLYNFPNLFTGGDLVAAIEASVLTSNTAGIDGGGISTSAGNNGAADLSLNGTNIVGNTAVDGGGVHIGGGPVVVAHTNVHGNLPDDYKGITDPTGTDGNLSVAPDFLDVSSPDPVDWDLHLAQMSALVGAGDPASLDPDGSTSDIGAYDGSEAGSWDLDQDGYPFWWQPGEYDLGVYPGQGWDCDDRDAGVWPGNGC